MVVAGSADISPTRKAHTNDKSPRTPTKGGDQRTKRDGGTCGLPTGRRKINRMAVTAMAAGVYARTSGRKTWRL